MTSERNRARLTKMLGANADQVHRNPSHGISARTGRGNAGKKEAWAAGGNLVSGDANKNVSLQYTFEKPGAHIVQFNYVGPKADPVAVYGAAVKCEALITFETNGNTVTRRVSVGEGTTVQGSGESVKVVVYDTTELGDSVVRPDDLGRVYSVGVSVAPGTRGSFTNPPILSENNTLLSLPGPSTVIVNIPDGSGANSVLVAVAAAGVNPIPEQGIQVEQLFGSGFGITTLMQYDPRAFAFAPLAPGVKQIKIRNKTLAAIYASVIWGIDG
jgi:hypothetical protein